jgi:hypothetical protein
MADIQVMGVCPNRAAAERVVGNLRLAGFSPDGVSLIVVRRDEAESLAGADDQHGEGAGTVMKSAAKLALLGAAIGLVIGFGTLFIPGLQVLSPVILLALYTFSGAFVGALAGAFETEDTAAEVVERYGMALREGQVVIRVEAEDAPRAQRAEALLRRAGAANVNSYFEDDSRITDIPGVREVALKR